MGAKLLAAIERLKKAPWVVLALLLVSVVGGLAQFTGATKALVDLVRPAKPDPRLELAKLGIPYNADALATAARNGDTRAAQLLVASGMTADAGMPRHLDDPVDNDSPVVAAASAEHDTTFEALVDAGADISRTNDAGWSAFDLVAMAGRVDAVRHVLARKPGQDMIDHAFKAAAWGGRDGVETVRLLAPYVDHLPRRASAALADIAGEKRGAAMARVLLGLGASPTAADEDGVGVLHTAAAHGEVDFVRSLLRAGAPVDAPSKCFHDQATPSTALWCAADYGVPATAAVLIAAGASPNARGPEGTTPLVRAAERLEDPAFVDLLLSAGADPRVRTTDGKTVLERAHAAVRPGSGDPKAAAAIFTRLKAAVSPAAARPRS